MRFTFDKAACQNTRRALQKEWLQTNGLGDYSSSTILACNTRKYHGLLVAASPNGRQVLLSSIEESVRGGGREFFISTRQHPGQLYPLGHQYMEKFVLDPWPQFTYRVGDVRIKRELLLVPGKTRLIMRWTLEGPERGGAGKIPQLSLSLKPLLAYRGFHQLTHANNDLNPHTESVPNGFGIAPYAGMPPIYFQVNGYYTFKPRLDWYYNVEYFQERDRGFDFSEDLYQPGILEIPLPPLPEGGSVYMACGTEQLEDTEKNLADLWAELTTPQIELQAKEKGLIGHLEKEGEKFLVQSPSGRKQVIAGYHWFDAWGRDTLIALPGLAFYGGRTEIGLEVLAQVPQAMRNGLIPNMFGDNDQHAYNSADASLWYAFAVQCYLKENPKAYGWVRENAWPSLKQIIEGYKRGPGMDIYIGDNHLLHAGNAHTQLTWMDANSNGQPVTPRNGCPVELNALWYNTLAFVDHLARKFDEPEWQCHEELRAFQKSFFEHFWVARDGGYLGDVWSDGNLNQSIRPNQVLAVSLPYPALMEQYRPNVMENVRVNLLTPFGLRTLAPSDPNFHSRYEGGPAERDAAYHQGTIWPWLLGQYTDGLLRVANEPDEAARKLLHRVTPLFTEHLLDAGLGSLSEIFDASPPARPNGTIAQAWSVAECLRMLVTLQKAAPKVYAKWEEEVSQLLANPKIGDTVGLGRATINQGDNTKSPHSGKN